MKAERLPKLHGDHVNLAQQLICRTLMRRGRPPTPPVLQDTDVCIGDETSQRVEVTPGTITGDCHAQTQHGLRIRESSALEYCWSDAAAMHVVLL